MDFLREYFRLRRRGLVLFILCCGIFAAAFALYGIPLKTVFYPAGLCAALSLGFLCFDCCRHYRKHKTLRLLEGLPENMLETLSVYDSLPDQDYQNLLARMKTAQQDMISDADIRFRDSVDYYTTWVHQIKTPIAAMYLALQNEDTGLSRKLTEELMRVEQYADMVLTYLRLDSDSTDYVFREVSLDEVIRPSLRKFAGHFIGRGLRLDYAPISETVITDEKWLAFVFEQILSNALKYTPAGSIHIYLQSPLTLCVQDTGIGIAPEDLPRIFERGYTGCNGRADRKATGLGLYLCKRILHNLQHGITVESAPGQGTVVRLHLEQDRSRKE